jgi:glutamate/tyrosine decarboxylase-like PLP-dependent enzyme
MDELLHDAAARAARYLNGIDQRAVAPTLTALAGLDGFDTALPAEPTDAADVLAQLDGLASPAAVASAGGRYFGFVIGGALPAALAANWLAGAWDQDAGQVVTGPACAALESVALRWLLDVLALPADCAGAFVTGGTMANFSCLAAARHVVLERAGWDVEGDGLFGAPPVTVVVRAEAHVSVLKSLGLLGFGRQRVVSVATDEQGRMRVATLPRISGPTIVCAQAGNVNSGAVDPLREICAWAHAADAWVHVDGAFGLWAAAAPARAQLVAGAEDADSWATDAHKWLNVPYDCGLAFTRHGDALRAAMAASAAYLEPSETRQPDSFTPELSRRARGVEVWAALRSLGRAGLADLIERCCRHATRFADGLRAAGYEVLNDVTLNQVLVAFGDDEFTRRVIAGIQADGTCWCGGTIWHGRAAMRVSVSSWATTDADVERSLAAMLRVAAAARQVRH